jgi:glycosyltransferase involved in cell wall biosynthesis
MQAKLPLTVCIITLNEEDHIAACLASVDFAAEIVVVDSFSSDRTEELCKAAGVRFLQNVFKGHIEQKNFALQCATQDWVLSLDADERVSPTMRVAIETIFRNGPSFEGYSFRRVTRYLGRWIRHGAFYPDRKLRLFRRACAHWGGENPHDRIVLQGSCQERNEEILHYSYKDLADHIRTLNSFSNIQARNVFERSQSNWLLLRMVARSLWVVFNHLIIRRGFLDGYAGVIIAVFSGFAMFARYAKVYEQGLTLQGPEQLP